MSDKIDGILEVIERNEVKFMDFRFTDILGRFLHISQHVKSIDRNVFLRGVNFDSSSVEGWKSIEKSDMLLMPDVSTAFIDPFTSQSTLVVLCDVFDIDTGKEYSKDPRSTLKKAARYLISSGIGDIAYFGIEMECFIFDDVRFSIGQNSSFFKVDSGEGDYNSGRKYEYNNHGHRYERKKCYLSGQPVDTLNDIRAEILETLGNVNIEPTLHHHEVASAQCEVGFKYSDALASADNVQKCKYITHNVAGSYGKSATFMPKPIKDDNGNGMHMHQSLWRKDENLFAKGDSISDMCLYYIGGIIKHGRAISALSNPTTNSYKRLVPGYEAPNALTYSFFNRSSGIRIPYTSSSSKSERRIEARFPDPSANPYYAISAMLMAGIDGIKNKIHPGEAINENLFDKDVNSIEYLPFSLKESMESLANDKHFLTAGNIFTDDQIDDYIRIKLDESDYINKHPSPIEFVKYYTV